MAEATALDEATIVRACSEAIRAKLDQVEAEYGVEQLYPDPVKMCRELRDVCGLADISDLTDVPFPEIWQEAVEETRAWVDRRPNLTDQARAIFD